MYKNIFITGPPGSGKSTLLMGIVRELEARNIKVRGIVCPEVRRGRSRWGFRVVVYPDGVEEVLASVDIRSGPRVSKYRVNVDGFEKVGVVALEDSLRNPDIRVILIDEIGKMELFSRRFRDVVVRILESDKVVLGVLGRVRDPLVSSIRRRRDTLIVELRYNMSDKDRVLVKERILNSILSVVL